MKQFLTALILSVVLAGTAVAQTVTIKGKVIAGDDKLALQGAIIRLNASDSTKRGVQGYVTSTDSTGIFKIVSREKKSDVTISFMGYKTLKLAVEQGKSVVDLGTISLELDAIALQGTSVVIQGTMARVMGDTVQYNASSFKTNPDATAEDLVAKMPGVTKESDGSLSTQGQKISRVLLNGKEFFDSDPSMALKSLPSDAVQNIQFIDDQTESARFSGFDDGERIKTLNIITKAGVEKSIYGRAFAGYGTDERNVAGGNINIFNGDHKWTINGQTHNIGRNGSSFGEGGSSMRGGGMGRGMNVEGIDAGSFRTSANSDISRPSALAINYSGVMSEKFKMNGSYRFGNYDGQSSSASTRFNQVETAPRYDVDTNYAKSITNSHDFSAEATWTPNAKNRITIRPNFTYSNNAGNSFANSQAWQGKDGPYLNGSTNEHNRRYEAFNGTFQMWWQHAFSKPGRTMNLGGILNGNRNFGVRDQYSLLSKLNDMEQMKYDTINLISDLKGSGYTATGSITINEQLSKTSRLSANYVVSYNRTFADQMGLDWDELEQRYSILDTANTNKLNRNYTSQTVGLGYGYSKDRKINLNMNLDYLLASQNNDQMQPKLGSINSKYNFTAFQPRANIRWTPKQGQSIMLNIGMNSSFPSVTQLQDVLNNIDPQRVSKGNPNLEQSYTTSVMLGYNTVDVIKNRNFSIFGRLMNSDNSFARNVQFLKNDSVINGQKIDKGAQYSTYVNMDGAQNAMLFTNYSMGISPIKSNLSVGANYRFSRQPSMQDNVKYVSNSNNVGLSASLTSNISENIDFTLRYNPSVRLNTVNTGRFDRTYYHNFSGNANIYLTHNLFINADATWLNSFGTQNNYDQHSTLLNAAIGYKFLQNRAAEIKFQAFDILNQNRMFTQSTDNTFLTTNMNYSVLKQYFMVSFMYKFDTRKSKNANNSTEENSGERRWMPGGGPGGGHGPGGGGGGGGRMMIVQ